MDSPFRCMCCKNGDHADPCEFVILQNQAAADGARIAELENQIEEMDRALALCNGEFNGEYDEIPEEVEYRKLVSLGKEKRTKEQTARIRDIIPIILDNCDPKRLRERIAELEAVLDSIDTCSGKTKSGNPVKWLIYLDAKRGWHTNLTEQRYATLLEAYAALATPEPGDTGENDNGQ